MYVEIKIDETTQVTFTRYEDAGDTALSFTSEDSAVVLIGATPIIKAFTIMLAEAVTSE